MKNFMQMNSVKTKTAMTMLAFGASVLVVNASLVLGKTDPGNGVDGLGAEDYRVPSSSLPETNPNLNHPIEPYPTGSELVVIAGMHEGMAVSHVAERTGIIAMPESTRTLAGPPFNRHQKGKTGPISTVAELIAISDLHDKMTVSQVAEQAASITVPEPATIFAGAPLLLPFFAGTLRILRQNKMGQPKWLNAS
jgi:hypothetical protein